MLRSKGCCGAIAVTVAILAGLGTFSAGADLVDLGSVTRDTTAGLDWLDLTQSGGFSYEQIEAGAGGFSGNGWRHATTPEMCDFFARNVTEVSPCPKDNTVSYPTGTHDVVIDLLGVTGYDIVNGDYLRGLFDDSSEGGDPAAYASYGFAFIGKGNAFGKLRLKANEYPSHFVQVGQPLPDSGHFLVRLASPIPEPTTALLLALGLAGLGMRRRVSQRMLEGLPSR